MNSLMNQAKETGEDFLWSVCVYGVGILSMCGGLMLFGAWISNATHGNNTTFAISGNMTNEARVLVAWIALQCVLHLLRWFFAFLSAEDRVIPEQPFITSSALGVAANGAFVSFSAFFVLWALIATKAKDTNYWIWGVFYALSAFSYWAVKYRFVYGFKESERVRAGANQQGGEASNAVENVARKEKPSITFKDIMGNADVKRRLREAALAITAPRKEGQAVRNGILMDGEPGNGKTVMAEALAGELGLPLFKLTHSDVASQWVGERTVRIKAAFDQAIRNQPCVLFIDEIDSFISDRSTESSQTKEDRDVVNSLLTLLVDVRNYKVVVVAATNYLDRLDGAAVREGRFDFKVEITPPDEEARIGLLTNGLKKNAPKVLVDNETIKVVAQRWNGFSVKRILAVTEELPSYVSEMAEKGELKSKLEFDDFMAILRRIQGRKGVKPENVKPLSELVLPEVTRESLEMLAGRLRDPQRVERLGGTLPSGVLFYGPPGTGKTVACKALAKDVDWAFLIATGTDLARDPKAVERLYTKAKEIRPAIIFIDEADDLLRSRDYSPNTEATNKLLTIMDGVNDRVRDVVWVAATNHFEQIDPALLRGGRFTEKVEFVRPDANQLEVHVGKWIAQKGIKLSEGVSAAYIANMMGDESIANAEAVLQYAVNRAISTSKSDSVMVSAMDIERAMTTVLGVAG